MDLFPSIRLLVPDSGFLEGERLRAGVGLALNEPDIADNRDIAENADMGLNDGDQSGPGAPTQLEIKLMERHTLHQVATGFGFKARKSGVGELLIGRPIFSADGIEQLLGELQQMRCF